MNTTKSRSVNLGIEIDGKTIFLTATGIKVGSRGKVVDVVEIGRQLAKGILRRLRKALHRNGRVDLVMATL